ncbi:hypothetical protein AYX14_07075 [Cryptococcus neoformans]|nr:hypothetical protein AYX14_07075 [Cryptococcus neoformans var. grubii]
MAIESFQAWAINCNPKKAQQGDSQLSTSYTNSTEDLRDKNGPPAGPQGI